MTQADISNSEFVFVSRISSGGNERLILNIPKEDTDKLKLIKGKPVLVQVKPIIS